MAEKQRVLIVEDDPGTLALLTQIVIRAGYEPLRARRGEEGWALLQEERVDLLLLDLMMRDVDGWTLLETIKGWGITGVTFIDTSASDFIPSLLKLPFMVGKIGIIYGTK